MSDRSVSPGTVNPNVNFPPLVREIPDFPAPTYIHGSDADHDDEYLNNIRTVGAASGYPDDMSNLFPPTDNRRVPFTVSSALRHTDYKEEWEPKERRSDEYIAAQSKQSSLATVQGSELPDDGLYRGFDNSEH